MTGGQTASNRILFIGAGHVGAAAAYATMLRALFREIVLIDRDEPLARAQALDLADANALARPADVRAGSYADAADARIAVLTAGAAGHGNESRLSLAERSAAIVADCVSKLVDAGFGGVLVVASNPVDIMTMVAIERSRWPPARVVGTGTLLDSSRLRRALSLRLDVAPGAIDALVLGEHGDSEVAALSVARLGGRALCDHPGRVDLAPIVEDVRTSAYRIIEGKGHTAFGIATAIVRICEAIVRDERAVLPVSAWLDGQFGIDGVCLSLPCVLGAGGIESVLSPDLDADDLAALRRSAEVIREAYRPLRRAVSA